MKTNVCWETPLCITRDSTKKYLRTDCDNNHWITVS